VARLAQSKDPVIRGLVALALDKTTDDLAAVLPVLSEALRQEDPAPSQWRDPFVPSFEELAIQLLGRIGPGAASAAPLLLERLEPMEHPGDGDFRADPEAARVRIVLGALDAMGPAVLPDLRAGLESDYPVVRTVSAMALVNLGKEVDRAIPVLMESLEGPCGGLCVYSHTRRFDVGALARCGPSAVPDLLEAVKDPALRFQAVDALGMMSEDADAVAPLLTKALRDPHPAVRASTAEALGTWYKGADSAVPALIEATKDRVEEVAGAATAALASIYGRKIACDADLRLFQNLDKLERLDLSGKEVTDAGMVHLSQLRQLRHLRLPTTITDEGLAQLQGLANLESLELVGTPVSDAGLRNLTRMTRLRHLSLRDVAGITDAGLTHLKGLTSLETLGLRGTQVTDAGLAHLGALGNLRSLVLTEHVTDAGLAHLGGLKRLEHLNLLKSRVTREGVRRLKKALPGCDISYPSDNPFVPR
jgi:HEAT repeat protein